MDLVQHDGNPNHEDQPGEEAQRVGSNMRSDVSAEEQRQRVMHQINEQ